MLRTQWSLEVSIRPRHSHSNSFGNDAEKDTAGYRALIRKYIVIGRSFGVNDVNNLSHTSWNCKYHIVFAPKYRRKVFYGQKRWEIGEILRTLCNWKKVNIIEAEVCPDHIHMLVEIPPKYAVSSFMGYLKGKSSLMIYEKYPELKYKYRNREFWCRGYYVDTAGKNAKKIEEYIRRQLEEDQAGEQLTMGNF